ncbi:MAG: DUF2141 domain-containing protein [Deltaproteobacteria bacterium]|nr:DUF2141 domain-containing protein [Deltaproteobacteria bacterium]
MSYSKGFVFGLFFFALVGSANAADLDYGKVKVKIEGIKKEKGEVGTAIFSTKKGYPVHIDQAYEAEWVPLQGEKSLQVMFDGLPAGEYAVSVLHDENGNRKMERSTLGFPKEGVGFSNDQKVVLSSPKFEKCKFTIAEGEEKEVLIKLDYRD